MDRDISAPKRTILIVPGFMADTYSCEEWYVELSGREDPDVQFLWLVPNLQTLLDQKRYWFPESRERLTEPVYVGHLRRVGVPYIVGDIRKYNPVRNFFLFRRIFKRYAIDAVYTHFGYDRFWATLLAKLWGKATIWNEHWHSLGTRYVFLKRIFYRLFVDHFICVSSFIAATLPRQSHSIVVPNSIRLPERKEQMAKPSIRLALGLPPEGTIVLMVAAFTKQKRHSLALGICKSVIQERKDTTFIFLGDGPEREEISRLISEAELSSHILLPGHVANVDDYYRAADLCMFTAYNDAAPLAILEAMKHELPMVAFACGGPVEFIRQGQTGVLVPEGRPREFANALRDLVDDVQERERMGRNAFNVICTDYNLNKWAERMIGALKCVLRAPQPPAQKRRAIRNDNQEQQT